VSVSEPFSELVASICKRPRMHTFGGTLGEVAAYLYGFAAASSEPGVSEEFYGFQEWMTRTFHPSAR